VEGGVLKKQHIPPQIVIDAVVRDAVLPEFERVHRETGKPVRCKCAVWAQGERVPQPPVDVEPHSPETVGECRLSFRPTSVPGRSLFRAQVRLPHAAPDVGFAGFDVSGDAKLVDDNVVLSRVVRAGLYGPQPFRDDDGRPATA
jgi:hypothetical protein